MSARPAWIAWRYLMARHVWSVLVVVGIVGFLLFCISLAEFGRRDINNDTPFLVLVEMALLQVPVHLLRTLPLTFLIGVLWSHMQLSRRGTISIVRSAGFTPYHTMVPIFAAAVLVGVVFVAGISPISAGMSARLDRLESIYFRGVSSFVALPEGEVWLRQFTRTGQSVIHAERVSHEGMISVEKPKMFGFDEGGGITLQVNAERAILWDGYWEFIDAEVRDLSTASEVTLPQPQFRSTLWVETTLTAAQIMDSFAAPEAISVWRIGDFITSLVSAGFDARRHRIHFHSLISLPLVLAAMGLVGGLAGMGYALEAGRFRVVIALLAGLGIYLSLYVVEAAAVAGKVPLLLAHWCAVAAILLASLGALLHWEPG